MDNDTGYAAFLKSNNLQVVEGIGPKIEGILKGKSIENLG
ncbi:MAG: putative flap endonuclease-1-like 5' DNA nuclease [Saprospiraceae bacterium]|jgi:predicted flap endonuclease-1-like 5' DNA nuclease